ncbi:MAG: hypothetical protein QXD23_03415 [Candidatus Micrarchaeaceae archaeon]
MEKELFELEQRIKQIEKLRQYVEGVLKELAPDKTFEDLEKEFKDISEAQLIEKLNEVNKKIAEIESQLSL